MVLDLGEALQGCEKSAVSMENGGRDCVVGGLPWDMMARISSV